MENYVTVQGNLTGDPTGRTTASGATLVRFRLASNGRRFDKQAGEYRDTDPLYIDVCCWRTLAGNVLATLRKGDSVIVAGKLLYRTYDNKEGVRQQHYEIDAHAVGPDLNRWPADLRRPSKVPAEEAARYEEQAAAPVAAEVAA